MAELVVKNPSILLIFLNLLFPFSSPVSTFSNDFDSKSNTTMFTKVFTNARRKLVIMSDEEDGGRAATVLSGTAIAKEIRENLKNEVEEMQKAFHGCRPGLAIIQVGNRPDSNAYIRVKMKAAAEIGIKTVHFHLSRSVQQYELLNLLKRLNENSSFHGILVQMPLDCDTEIDPHLITNSVSPDKDVDGLHNVNQGKLATGDLSSGFIPCTPKGILELISRSKIDIAETQAVVIGRSKIVGTPVSELLKWHNATVTTCHLSTKNIDKITAQADILVVAIGSPKFVRGSWIKRGAVVIDCGINCIEEKSKVSGSRLVGDVHYEEACKIAGYITPVPGGVGPMTVAMLMKNTVIAAQSALKELTKQHGNVHQ